MKKLFIILLASIVLTSCTITKEVIKEVPVEVTKTEYKTEYIHDSIHEHDSTYIYKEGDTVFKTKWQLKYIERIVHDSLIIHDSIPVYLNNTKYITNTVNKPQWWPVWLALGIVLLYFLITKTKFLIAIKDFIKYIIKLFK